MGSQFFPPGKTSPLLLTRSPLACPPWRIPWRIQANAWGGLSERARGRALEIADDADLRIPAPKNFLKEEPDQCHRGLHPQ